MKSKIKNSNCPGRCINLLKFVLVEMKGGMICDFPNWLHITQMRQVKKYSLDKLLKNVS